MWRLAAVLRRLRSRLPVRRLCMLGHLRLAEPGMFTSEQWGSVGLPAGVQDAVVCKVMRCWQWCSLMRSARSWSTRHACLHEVHCNGGARSVDYSEVMMQAAQLARICVELQQHWLVDGRRSGCSASDRQLAGPRHGEAAHHHVTQHQRDVKLGGLAVQAVLQLARASPGAVQAAGRCG